MKTEDLCVLINTNELENQIPMAMKIFPNPNSTGTLHLELDSDIRTELQYSIFNILGKKVGEANEMDVFLGENNYNIDITNLVQGSYFLKINNANFQKTLPFQIF